MDLVEVNVQPSSGKPLMDVKSDDASGASIESEGLVKKPAWCTLLLVVELSGTLLNCYWGRGRE